MEHVMAPPAKRRKVQEDVLDLLEAAAVETTAPFSHSVEHIGSIPISKPQRLPQRVDEVHLEIRKQPVMGADERAWLQRRQGTAAMSDASSTGADVVVSVVASLDALGSTTTATLAAITLDLPNMPSFPSTSTTTVLVSDASSSSSYGSSSASSTYSASETSSTGASSTDSSSSGTASQSSSTASSASASATSSSYSPSTTGSEGFIGASAGVASYGTASSSSLSSSSASNSSSTATSSDSIVAGTVSGYTASTNFPTLSSGQNLTTSATTISSGSSTYTSDATINLASISSNASDSQSSQSSTAFLGAVVYIATLDDGRLATITRSSRPYTTTLPNGSTSAISPYPSSDASRVASTTLSDGSVSVLSNLQSTVQSTVYSTTTASDGSVTETPLPAGVGAAGTVGTATTSASSTTSSAAGGGGGGSSAPAPAGTIAGGVVGGAAGLALVLLAAMLFLRWYRRKAGTGHQALPTGSAGMSPDMDQMAPVSRGGPGMAERAGLMPFVAAVPGLFRHQNRSRDSATGGTTGERGFERVSGRKLPSQFSEGMTAPPRDMASPPPTMPLVGASERNMSNTSFYRDSQGFYGGEGQDRTSSSNPFSDLTPIDTDSSETRARAGEPIMSPGPQRKPTVHHGGPYVMSPTTASSESPRGALSPGSPPWTAGTNATFSRSETPASFEGSRGSRFMEEV